MGVSTCTQKVVLALKEKSIPFDFININVLKGEQKVSSFHYAFSIIFQFLMRYFFDFKDSRKYCPPSLRQDSCP